MALAGLVLLALELLSARPLWAERAEPPLRKIEVSTPLPHAMTAGPVIVRLGDLFSDGARAPKALGLFCEGKPVPCQLDEIDGVPGPSPDDELCFLADLPAHGSAAFAIHASVPDTRPPRKMPVTVDAPWLAASAKIVSQSYEAVFLRRDYMAGTLHCLSFTLGEQRLDSKHFEGTGFGLLAGGSGQDERTVLSFRDGLCGANDVESPAPLRCANGPVRAVAVLDLAARHYRGSRFRGAYHRMYNPRLGILETDAVKLEEIPDVLLRKAFFFYPDGRIRVRKELINRSKGTARLRGPVYASPHPFVFEFFLPLRPFVGYRLSNGQSGTLPSPDDPDASREKLKLDASGWIELQDAKGLGITLAVKAGQLQLRAMPHVAPPQPPQVRFIGTLPKADLPPGGRYGVECEILINDGAAKPADRLRSFFHPVQWRIVP